MMHRRSPSPMTPILALVLIASTLSMVVPTGSAATTTRVLTIDTDHAQPTEPFANFDGNPTKLYDIDGDGDLEIIAQNDNDWVYVFDSRTGEILAEVPTTIPSGWGGDRLNGPEAAVLEQGGQVRIVVASSASVISSFVFDEQASNDTTFAFDKEWERRLNTCYSDSAMDAKPVFADLDNDGTLEILGATEEYGLYALRHDGSMYWTNCLGGGNAAPGVGDLNGDGLLDVIHVSDTGVVAAIHGQTGDWLWGYTIKNHYDLRSASITVAPGIGQLDGVGGPDIVVGARDSHDTENYDNNNALLLALDSNGHRLWDYQDPDGNPLTYTRPIIVDTDGDGHNEVYWGDWNTVGHKGGIPEEDWWQVTGPGHFYRFDHQGDRAWRQSLDTYWSNKDLALADVDNDGEQEVLANGPKWGEDGIWYLNGKTGAKEAFVSVHPWKVSRGPVVGDLYGDGTMQWVVQTEAATSSVSGGAVLVFDTGVPYDADWPHVDSPSAGPDDGAGGTFDATYDTPGGNEWWVEVKVHASASIAQVHASADGGPWHALSKRSWGAWAGSFHVPDGSMIEFRATDADGDTNLSQRHQWPDGTPQGYATDGGSSGSTFEASYDTPGGNEWWVEVFVESTQILDAVDARADGGSWHSLSKRDWGAWAGSFHVPDGATVEFRAHADDATHVSAGYVWPSGDPATGDDGGTGDEPAPAFDATFSTPGGNEWWVEAYVDANDPLAGVDARVDGGSWVALSLRDWGAWAKSFHVPDGSTVEFRATSGDGDVATSGSYVWPSGDAA